MIVTCESCKSRYKLDDAKITGRGAKITCPKCKAVFVVYAQPTAPQPPPPKVEEPPPAPAAPPEPGAWDDEPTRVGDTLSPPEPPPTRPAEVRTEPRPELPKDPAQLAARAASLDFKKVGVPMWKVKVKIGLIYDFSDIKTLRKYIQDGRVTSTDVISWDGKSWRAIGDIPDLDAFFVETYEMLAERKQGAADGPASVPPPSAPASEPQRTVVDSTENKTGGEPNQFQDPFAESRRKQKERAERNRTAPVPIPPKPAPAPNRTPVLVAALVLLVLLGGGGFWWWQQQSKVVVPTPAATTGPTPASNPEDIKKKLEDELRRNLEQHPADPVAPVESTPAPASPEALTPRTPPGAPIIPEGATARIPRSTPTSSPTIKQADQTAADHEAVGDDAAAGGDWSTAAQAYQAAVGLDGKSGRLRSKLGRAQYEAGDLAAAQATLQKAAQMGSKDAHKYLGHIARTQGDVPGATFQYQEYLKGSPKDAAEIKQILTQLSGG